MPVIQSKLRPDASRADNMRLLNGKSAWVTMARVMAVRMFAVCAKGHEMPKQHRLQTFEKLSAQRPNGYKSCEMAYAKKNHLCELVRRCAKQMTEGAGHTPRLENAIALGVI